MLRRPPLAALAALLATGAGAAALVFGAVSAPAREAGSAPRAQHGTGAFAASARRARRAGPVSPAYHCRVFPADNVLNREIASAPEDPRSSAYIASIGATAHLHPDFGRNPAYGIPYAVVGAAQRRVPIRFSEYGAESDPGPYPVPAWAPVEGAGAEGDRHVLVAQEGKCRLYELYSAHRQGSGWSAASGAVFDLRRNALRPEGWTSADAAGLPIFPLLVRYPEVAGGRIAHALRVTVPRTQRGYIHPATHYASSSSNPDLPPMGLRLRLRAGYSLAGYHGEALVILQALKRYGLIVADNGSPWYITGAPDVRWNEADMLALERVPGSQFEAVRSGAILHR